MNDIWYKKLGFNINPFSIKPAAFHDEIFGVDSEIKEIFKLLKKGSFIFICGEYGKGKTSLLKKIVNKYKGNRKVAYFSGNQINRHLNVDQLLVNAGGFLSRLFQIKSENIILLLDEVQDLDQNDANDIVDAYEEGYIKSVILVSAREKFEQVNKKFHMLIGKNKFELKGISDRDAVKLVRKRVGKLPLLSDEMIKKIYSYNKNPRAMLKNMEDVCKYAVDNGEDTVKEEHIKKALK